MLSLLYLRKMFDVIKILYLILFYLIYRITDIVLLLVLLVQTILNIFSGGPSESIKEFGKSLGIYLQQISEFLSYASEEKPFPFSDWPERVSSNSDELAPSSESFQGSALDAQDGSDSGLKSSEQSHKTNE